ncbi:MAG TPA: radical SAM family heme chaperone HemW [Woeseiaceae bacterium]|nr:radical SAM family heme chaperone HemW [Woeseiaceae bacterium]
MMAGLPPLSVYLHLPWCVRKCPYCDFNSHTAGAEADPARYARALAADLARAAREVADRTVETVFLGGGTPSFFTPAEIGRVLDAVRESFRLAPGAEITMEANPGTLESGRLAGFREAGVNRLSLGAQSFDDAALRRLGRIHDAGAIRRAFHEAREAGFDNVNLDLMFGLPGQDLAGAAADLDEALRLGPEHLSRYQLTLEPNTRFHAVPPAGLPDEDLAFEMQERGRERLARAGYAQYEVSAYARPGRRCRHNLNYWLFGDYVGAGAGAHGKLTRADGTVRRTLRTAHPRLYMEQVEAGSKGPAPREVTREELGFEYLLNALRLNEGFTEAGFRERTGLSFRSLAPQIEEARGRGLLADDGAGGWRASRLGRLYLNDLQALFLPEPAPSRGAAAAVLS